MCLASPFLIPKAFVAVDLLMPWPNSVDTEGVFLLELWTICLELPLKGFPQILS